MSDIYAEERAATILRNRQLLESLGLNNLKPRREPKEKLRSKAKVSEIGKGANKPPQKVTRVEDIREEIRRSSRISSKPVKVATQEPQRGPPLPISVKNIVHDLSSTKKGQRRHNPKVYGSIPGIEVGSWWAFRKECSDDSIHAPWVGGIAPGKDGAYSVALSGGYDDDVDDGYAFTYTGAGGRDLKGTKAAPKNLRTAEQSSDQSIEHIHNRALKRSVETGKPVRVIRGFKLQSRYGPSEGYRYDGLYVVKKYWQERGLNKGGHLVCKFAFVRLPGQPDIPVNGAKHGEPGGEGDLEFDV
ncbi:PUA-like domain-containing protein [Phlebopus sp. FC_14]|nr:PUA-like domain-containing protein [Phlebopus sp. FC_14]